MSPEAIKLVPPPRLADAATGTRHVFVRDLIVDALIGVHPHEHDRPQRVRINLDLAVGEGEAPVDDDLVNVVDYEALVDGVTALIARGHVKLVETLADDVATMCLGDRRVHSARVRIEKLDVFAQAESVGVEIERFNTKV